MPTDTDTVERFRKARVARIWQGRTTARRADEYERYLYENGIKKIAATKGNLGVQMMRHSEGEVVEFITISYWASRDDIKSYAGEDIEKPHHLARDAEFLLELPEAVKNCDLKTNEWK
jgi:heme-degrading monooxygenase HmoA